MFEETYLRQLLQDPEDGDGERRGGALIVYLRSKVVKALVTAEAVKALESRDWSAEALADDHKKWTHVLRWSDDLFDGSKEDVLLEVASWLQRRSTELGVRVVPYGALPYRGVGSNARAVNADTVIELPSWESDEEAKAEDDGEDVNMSLSPLVRRRNYEEALDFLRLPFHVLNTQVNPWE